MSNKFNKTLDLKNLLIYDTNPFPAESITEDDIVTSAVDNLKHFYGELYNLQKNQVGVDEENRDFDVGPDNVTMPASTLILPRRKIPKAKALTKWEKYRKDKGMAPRQKRSRMVYSELAKDWVPRWGHRR
jgi:regulator of ribosome biosynthesis